MEDDLNFLFEKLEWQPQKKWKTTSTNKNGRQTQKQKMKDNFKKKWKTTQKNKMENEPINLVFLFLT